MDQSTQRQAVFAGLVYSEEGQPVETTYIGQEPYYIIMEGDFKRHVAAEDIDRQVIDWLQEQTSANKDVVTEGMMAMLGKDDLFTKAMIDASLHQMHKIMEMGLPADARTMLGMMGFKVIVNMHGEMVNLEMPGRAEGDEF